MYKLLDGKEVSENIKNKIRIEVENLKAKGIKPKLAVILVGNDPASKIYVKNKSKACEYTGIEYEEFLLNEDIEEEKLINLINDLNAREDINGILIQSPLPEKFDENKMFSLVSPLKDVDCFTEENVGKLFIGNSILKPCTPSGIIEIFNYYNIDLEGKNVVIIGRSNIVGKPMIECLLERNATVTICHSKTKNITNITKDADILISATGRLNMVTVDMVKEDVIIIDVGMNRNKENKLVGDVDFENVSKKASYITPVPGGVGPMTIAMLMRNVVNACKMQNKIM